MVGGAREIAFKLVVDVGGGAAAQIMDAQITHAGAFEQTLHGRIDRLALLAFPLDHILARGTLFRRQHDCEKLIIHGLIDAAFLAAIGGGLRIAEADHALLKIHVLPLQSEEGAAALLGLCGLGIVAAVGTAFLLKRTLLRAKPSSFLMELPPYRVPSPRSLALRLLDRSRVFLRRAGTIIFAVAIVLWTLTQFPRIEGGAPPIDDSALGRMGQVIEPAIEPLGFDWRIGVGLVTSLAAREVIVGTLGTIYGVEDASDDAPGLQEALRQDLTRGSAIGLLVFFVFALQCMSTVAVMRRETAGWKWPILQFTYMLLLAYVGAFVAVRIF